MIFKIWFGFYKKKIKIKTLIYWTQVLWFDQQNMRPSSWTPLSLIIF